MLKLRINGCVKAVFMLGIGGGLVGVLHTTKKSFITAVCVISRFITNPYTAFTSGYAPLINTKFGLLNPLLMPTIHTTNKNNKILYKLITIS